MNKFRYISNITKEELNLSFVIPCINEEGFKSILIRNKENKSTRIKMSTDNLLVQLDTVLKLDDEDYYFHIITAKKNDMYSLSQFNDIYDYIFKKFDSPILGKELMNLISSIEEYFKTTPEPNLQQMQIGVYGELLTIKHLHDIGLKDIVIYFHTNFFSKHDIEISKKIRMEVKSSVSEKRIHRFSHSQIFRNDVDVYVCSVLLEKSKEGKSLYDLFEEVIELYSDPESILYLKKLRIKCNLNEDNKGLTIAYDKAINDFKVYNVINLPKINISAPDGVYNIKYDVDCSLAIDENLDELIKKITN